MSFIAATPGQSAGFGCVDRGEPTLRLIRCLAPLALGLMIFAAAPPARAIDAVSVRSDAPAIDLTAILDHQRSETDRIQVSTAPGTDGIVRRIEVRAREGGQNWVVFALANNTDDQLDRLIVAPHYRIVSSGIAVARSRTVAHRHHHAVDRRPSRAAGQRDRRHLPHHARSRRRGDLCRGAAHRQAAAALSVGARRLQGQGQLVHALPGHRDRHFRIAGAGADHPVRGQGQHHVPGRSRAGVGGAGLYRRRFRLLGQSARHVEQRRAGLARVRRGDPGRDAIGVPVRLSQFEPLACALLPYHRRLARLLREPGGAGAVRSRGRIRHRADVAGADRLRRLCADRLSFDARFRPRGAADPDLVPAGGLGDRGRHDGRGQRHQRYRRSRAAWRPGADRDADRIYGDAARLRRRRHDHRHRLRYRTPRAGADRLRRPDLGLGCRRRQGVYQPRDRSSARAETRHAGRPGREMAGSAASARPGPIPRRARQRAGPAPRPAGAGFPAAHAGRPFHVVRA